MPTSIRAAQKPGNGGCCRPHAMWYVGSSMPLTVRELVRQPSLGLQVLVEGELDRPIRWVHATEQPDPTPYLRGGEVVLTDGVALRQGTAAGPYVRRLRRTGVAALGYGLIEGQAPVPASLIDA